MFRSGIPVWLAAVSLACGNATPAPAAPPSVASEGPARAAPSEEARRTWIALDAPVLDRALLAGTLLLDGAAFVGPSSPRPEGTNDDVWRLVHEPREQYVGNRRELVFFAQIDGVLHEVHVDALTADVTTTPLASIAAQASAPSCEAPMHCGCFSSCVEVVRIGADGDGATYRTLGAEGGETFHRGPYCYEGTCARVCSGPNDCVDALSPTGETCTGACAPEEATFHCERGPSGCVSIAHGA